MKKITFLAALALTGMIFAQDTNLPITFESGSEAYDDALFGGLTGGVIANPDATGENTSANVFSATKPTDAETFAGVAFSQSVPVDFSDTQLVTLTVWAPSVGTKYTVKIEDVDGNDGPFIQLSANTTTAMEWEVLEFDFSSIYVASRDYVNVVIFPELDNAGTGDTYYFDDLALDGTLSLKENSAVTVSVFPNPTTDIININTPSTIKAVSIFNVLGQEVSRQLASGNTTEISVATLKAGVYLAEVETLDGTQTVRFVKQ